MFSVDDDRGILCRGSVATKQVPGQKPVSSIPAKFETVLFKGPREKKGFGSEGRRFSTLETENPGPGSYANNTSSLNTRSESYGVKGFGSMTSSTKRLSGRKAYTGPGPGTYKQEFIRKEEYSPSATANFADRTVVPASEIPSPGPGTYSAEDITKTGQKLDWEPPQSHKSAFKGTAHKLILSGNKDAPPPGQYNMPELWEGKPGSRGPSGATSGSYSKAGSSAFAGGASSSLAGMSSTMFLEDPKESQKPDTGPGPGSYSLQCYKSIRSGMERTVGKSSASFVTSDVVNRFGVPLASHNPEPEVQGMAGGTSLYSSQGVSRISSPVKGVSAPFISQTVGRSDFNIKEAGKAPGPAYYQPDKPYKKSFHLNTKKRLVP
eukprot:gene32520-17233_t